MALSDQLTCKIEIPWEPVCLAATYVVDTGVGEIADPVFMSCEEGTETIVGALDLVIRAHWRVLYEAVREEHHLDDL